MPDSLAGHLGGAPVVPLSQPAVLVLHEIPRLLGNPHVFASPKRPDAARVDLKRVWKRIRRRSDLMDVHLHDLRRTVGSWLAMSGEGLPLIGKVLGHSNPSTTAIYARLTEDAGRRALEEYAERILGARANATNGP